MSTLSDEVLYLRLRYGGWLHGPHEAKAFKLALKRAGLVLVDERGYDADKIKEAEDDPQQEKAADDDQEANHPIAPDPHKTPGA